MQLARRIAEVKAWRHSVNGSVGCVPTMGYLHQGHLELARRSKAENNYTTASIFVNPTQFGPKEDLASYPRDLDRDLSMLDTEGVDLVFTPSGDEMYPDGFDTWIEVKGVSERLEGAARPGHFKGVTTVVSKLFNIMEPTRAYFGQKDAQQVAVVQKMVRDLDMNVDVVVVPTVREADGLAMSSRNVYLSPEQRKAAVVLWRALSLAEDMWLQGERNAENLRREMKSLIGNEPQANVEYVSVADASTLEEMTLVDRKAVISMAVRFGKTRLIDNIILG